MGSYSASTTRLIDKLVMWMIRFGENSDCSAPYDTHVTSSSLGYSHNVFKPLWRNEATKQVTTLQQPQKNETKHQARKTLAANAQLRCGEVLSYSPRL